MRKLILLTITFFIISDSKSQDYSKKYNRLLDRYEFFNSNKDLIGYSKWNSITQSWEYTNVNSTSTNSYQRYKTADVSEYVDVVGNQLQIMQANYSRNKQKLDDLIYYTDIVLEAMIKRKCRYSSECELSAKKYTNFIRNPNNFGNIAIESNFSYAYNYIYNRYNEMRICQCE